MNVSGSEKENRTPRCATFYKMCNFLHVCIGSDHLLYVCVVCICVHVYVYEAVMCILVLSTLLTLLLCANVLHSTHTAPVCFDNY